MPFSNRKQSRATIEKAHPALVGKKEENPLSVLNQFNKTYNEADSSEKWVLACADSHYESKIV